MKSKNFTLAAGLAILAATGMNLATTNTAQAETVTGTQYSQAMPERGYPAHLKQLREERRAHKAQNREWQKKQREVAIAEKNRLLNSLPPELRGEGESLFAELEQLLNKQREEMRQLAKKHQEERRNIKERIRALAVKAKKANNMTRPLNSAN